MYCESLWRMVSRMRPSLRGDHVAEVVEDGRVLAHGVGQGRAALHRSPDAIQRLLESGILLVCSQDLETLHERQSGIDHDRELPEKDGDVFGLDLAGAKSRKRELFPLFRDHGHGDLLLSEHRDGGVFVFSDEHALLRLAGAGAALPRIVRHLSVLLIRAGAGGASRPAEPPAAAAGAAPRDY